MKIRNGRDFWAGLMFVGSGVGFMLASRAYPIGTAVRMGPAYFPMVLGGLLAALGLIVFLRGFFSSIPHGIHAFPFRFPVLIAGGVLAAIVWWAADWFKAMGPPGALLQTGLSAIALFLLMGAFGPRPLIVILISVVAFGYLLKPLGLVLATAVLIIGSAWGGHEFKIREVLILFAVLAIFSVAIFIYGLGLPMNIWPNLD